MCRTYSNGEDEFMYYNMIIFNNNDGKEELGKIEEEEGRDIDEFLFFSYLFEGLVQNRFYRI